METMTIVFSDRYISPLLNNMVPYRKAGSISTSNAIAAEMISAAIKGAL